MRVFVAGGAGVVGRNLIPMLIAAGHQVTATTRSPARTAQLQQLGADPVVADGLDRDAVIEAVTAARPDVIIHQLTALAGQSDLKHFDRNFAVTNELRNTNDSLLATKQNDIVTRLTIMAFATFPLTVITGLFGINAPSLPFMDSPYAFWIIIAIMAASVTLFVSYFRFRKWL